MAEFIFSLVILLVIIVLAHMYYKTKIHTIDQICNHPELSDDKVKSMTGMIKRQYKIKNN